MLGTGIILVLGLAGDTVLRGKNEVKLNWGLLSLPRSIPLTHSLSCHLSLLLPWEEEITGGQRSTLGIVPRELSTSNFD